MNIVSSVPSLKLLYSADVGVICDVGEYAVHQGYIQTTVDQILELSQWSVAKGKTTICIAFLWVHIIIYNLGHSQ